jgi:putative ABC transport system permease protein
LSAQVAALGTLGAVLGVATIAALGGMIFGPRTLGSQFHAPGSNVLTITSDDASGSGDSAPPGTARFLTTADVDAIARGVPDIAALSRAVFGTAPVVASAFSASGSEDVQTRIQGVDPSFAQVTSDMLAQGTWFSAQDASSANRVAVLGQTRSSQLFQNPQTAIGATIRIRNVPYTVIGVLAAHSGATPENTDDAVLIPFQTGQVRLFGTSALDAVLVEVADANQTGAVSQQVEQLLRQRHQVKAGQPDGFTIRTNRTAPAVGGVGGSASRLIGQALQLAWLYSCEGKGLCARAPG